MSLTFETWEKAVDREVANRLCGLGKDDLPDCPYREWYDDGVTPNSAARMAIARADGNDEDDDYCDE